jgi:serine/threonine protein kinase
MTTSNISPEQLADLPISKELGVRYRILRQIGLGGFGVVYLALDNFEQRQVAIKVARWGDAVDVKKKMYRLWMNEVKSAGQLKHPFIVETYEAGLVAGGEYIIMEYLSGGTLKPFIQPENLLPIERVVEIIFKVCKALEYVYSFNILHRDIKPSNILLNHKGDIKVSDFGACYQTDSSETQVLDVGTFDYVPPEQFKKVSPNVQFDIYATGLMAYQLLTGHAPYTGETTESLIYQKLYVDPPPLSEWRQDIPARLSEVVLRAIARDPEQRYCEWKTLSDDLEGAMSTAGKAKEIANDSSKYNALCKLDFFREFDQKELWETIQISNWIRYKAGQVIFSEGDAGTSIYVIIIGEADILKGGLEINHMRQGACFGELAYIDKASHLRTASVVASTMLVALCIDGERLRNSSDGLQARFSGALLRAMLGKITQADKRYIAMIESGSLSF